MMKSSYVDIEEATEDDHTVIAMDAVAMLSRRYLDAHTGSLERRPSRQIKESSRAAEIFSPMIHEHAQSLQL